MSEQAEGSDLHPRVGSRTPIPTIDVIIVNWNAGRQLFECLESLARTARHGCEVSSITIVDNASTDGSADHLEIGRLPVRVLRNRVNSGFAAACNQGAGTGFGDYVLFLNPDTVLESESISVPIAVLESSAEIRTAIAGIQLYDEAGKISRTCTRFPSPQSMLIRTVGLDRLGWIRSYWMTEWAHQETRNVDHIIGAFYLVRRRVFEELGGFDERFFVYLEDLDFSLRANQAGWRSIYVAEARAFHKGGGTSERVPAQRLAYALRSRLQYADKHFSFAGALLVRAGTFALEPVIRFAHAALRLSLADIADAVAAYRLLLRRPARKSGG